MHPRILKIKSLLASIRLFDLNFVSRDGISKIITSKDLTKKTSRAIPTKIVELSNKQLCKDLVNCVNESIKKYNFPNWMKAADITPIFKKWDSLNKENYKPVSVLSAISKLSERALFYQLTKFSNKFLSPLLSSFRKGAALNMHP